MDKKAHTLSPLSKTWIFDIDGTIVKHNGHKIDGVDTLLPGAKAFFEAIPANDFVLLLTSRTEEYKEQTESFLRENGIRYDKIVYGAPFGERILINDKKPSGLKMACAINTDRDVFMKDTFIIDASL